MIPGQFTSAANKREGHTHVLLITTGSVASIKAPLIVEELLKVSKQTAQTPPRSIHFTSLLHTVQGRIGTGGLDQAVAHVLPAG